MALLDHFATPANLPEPNQAGVDEWSKVVEDLVGVFAGQFEQFYDPTEDDTPADAGVEVVAWRAFPARLDGLPAEERWERADSSRAEQDEYCEWSVERDGDEVTRVTFTSEVPQYFEHLHDRDTVEGTERLLDFYREFVDPETDPGQLLVASGRYDEQNPFNQSTSGRLAHLTRDNNLFAAIALAASATVLRQRNGVPVTTQQALVRCARLGNHLRHSDPQIAGAVNRHAAQGREITLRDPIGVYIAGIELAEMVAPDGADVADFWEVERGEGDRILRASFRVPEERGYTVSNVELAGTPIRFGAQLAERVEVKIEAVAKAAGHQTERLPCRPQ